MKYSRKKFLIAVGAGRSVRYFALAYLGSFYSKNIFGFFHEFYTPVLWTLIGLAVIGGLLTLGWFSKRKRIIPKTKDRPAKAA